MDTPLAPDKAATANISCSYDPSAETAAREAKENLSRFFEVALRILMDSQEQ